jgi:Outer membrane protein beta-barrel domain
VITQNVIGNGYAQPVLVSQDTAPKMPMPLTNQQLQNVPAQQMRIPAPNTMPLSMQALQPQAAQPQPMMNNTYQPQPVGLPPVRRMNTPTGYGVGAPTNYGANTGRYYIGVWGDVMKPSGTLTNGSQNFNAKYGTSLGFGAAAGYYMQEDVRVEGEIAYKQRPVDSVTVNGANFTLKESGVETAGLGVNAYYDFNGLHNQIVPYVGAGLGYQFVNGGGSGISGQVMGGAAYKLDNDLAIFAGYKYFTTQDIENDAGTTLSISDHIAEVGMRYNF